jgi:DHA1 family bicyclomycin/chloramphenicol resistance-like MFS transporter
LRSGTHGFVYFLPVLVALQAISTDLYLPALPSIVAAFGTDVARVQLTLSVFLAAFAMAQLVFGPLSDRFGRRPLLLLGTVLYVVASLACMAASSIEMLIACRFAQAVGACSGSVLGRAVIRDAYAPADAARVLAYVATAMAVAPALGPVAGGWLTVTFGWRATFAALAGFGAIAALGVLVLVPETNRKRDPDALRVQVLLANYRELLGSRPFLSRAAVAAFAYSGIFAFISGSPYVLIEVVGLSPDRFGLCFGAAVLGWALGSFGGARLGHRLGLEGLLRWGTILTAAAGLTGLTAALAAAPSVAGVVLPMMVFMVGAGFASPTALALAIGPYPTRAGLASSLLGFLQLTTASLIGIAVGLGYDRSAVPMMTALALVGVGAFMARRGTEPGHESLRRG